MAELSHLGRKQNHQDEAVSQRQQRRVLQDNRESSVNQRRVLQDNRTTSAPEVNAPTQRVETPQHKPNNTGLPNQLKAGIESLSGMSMDHVKVHYNSDKPAQLNAHAYAQGSDIHLAAGQEKHLPHEAWHLVQQAQGRVKPTMQMKGGVAVNDDKGLEKEADLMGMQAFHQGVVIPSGAAIIKSYQADIQKKTKGISANITQGNVLLNKNIQFKIDPKKFNMVGENHDESNERRVEEKNFILEKFKFSNEQYWQESAEIEGDRGDDPFLRFKNILQFINSLFLNKNDILKKFCAAQQPWSESMSDKFEDFLHDCFILIRKWEFEINKYMNENPEFSNLGIQEIYNNVLKKIMSVTLGSKIYMCKDAEELSPVFDTLLLCLKNSKLLYSAESLMIERSDNMHNFAERLQGRGVKGVWKVGDRHRKDNENKEHSYSLTSKEDFDTELVPYIKAKQDGESGSDESVKQDGNGCCVIM